MPTLYLTEDYSLVRRDGEDMLLVQIQDWRNWAIVDCSKKMFSCASRCLICNVASKIWKRNRRIVCAEAMSVNLSVTRNNEVREALEDDLCTKHMTYQTSHERRSISSRNWNIPLSLRLIA